jgi:hypothetical protein
MGLSTAGRQHFLAACVALVLVSIALSNSSILSVWAQQPPQPGAPESDVSNLPRAINDTFDRVNMRDRPKNGLSQPETVQKDDSCLLPPLTQVSSPTIAVGQLRIEASAKGEYLKACAALKKKKKDAEGEKHLRKAVERDPKYAAAWVTLGQVLARQQRIDEARSSCLQGSVADSSYVPAYLCLADLAARAHAWDEVLKLSSRALELDAVHNAVAYEYHAAANLNLHDLVAAEKSGLRAVEIDKDQREPRIHFVLAQIYEAKGDSANENLQLREYLKYANNAEDVAVVQHYLLKLEQRTGEGRPVEDTSAGNSRRMVSLSTREWGPRDIDEAIPPVRTTTCPLSQILKETSRRTQDLIDNLQRFSASEQIAQIDIDKRGKSRNVPTQVVNYVAQVSENSSGYPTVREYRLGRNGVQQGSLVDAGTAAFALIFHPTHLENFAFRCEGLTELRASPAWQVHFEESGESTKSFQAIKVGGAVYLPRLKGRAWITPDSYDVLQIETDLMFPIPQIDLQMEHVVIGYAPVEFHNSHVRLWLPESASLYITYRGRRYQRVHSFSQFQLFSVDATPTIKEPSPQFLAHK